MTLARPMFPPGAGLACASVPPGLARQERRRRAALERLASLRAKASVEIERLIAFLDASDEYVATEIEADDSDDEPSLGSHEIREAGAVSYLPSWDRVAGYDVEEQCDDEGMRV